MLLCLFYPAVPCITPGIMKKSMEVFVESQDDSVFPVVKFSSPPQRGLVLREGRIQMVYPENYNARSQDLEDHYHDCGMFYWLRSAVLIKEEKLICQHTVPIVLRESEIQDIDCEEDWKIAEMKYRVIHSVKPQVTT